MAQLKQKEGPANKTERYLYRLAFLHIAMMAASRRVAVSGSTALKVGYECLLVGQAPRMSCATGTWAVT